MPDTAPVLQRHGYLRACQCRDLHEQFSAHLDAGRVKPRGGDRVIDVPLVELAPLVELPASCGAPSLDLRKLRDDLAGLVGERFGLADLRSDYSAYSRMTAGGFHALHADAVTLDGRPNHTPHRAATAIIYLTPHGWEFSGGELVFPMFKLTITPAPGLVVAFPCTLDYKHLVKRVLRGRRDALVFWFMQGEEARKAEAWPDVPAQASAA